MTEAMRIEIVTPAPPRRFANSLAPNKTSEIIGQTWHAAQEPVEEPSLQPSSRRKEWTLNASAFRRLLNWLDETETSGHSYLELRRRLVAYFDRKDCPAADDLADETLNRVARRLEEEGSIEAETPAKYCYIVARFVFMESLRDRRRHAPIEEGAVQGTSGKPLEEEDERMVREKRLLCLDRCSQKLSADNRELILRYYIGSQLVKIKNRRAMANQLGISVNALTIRACRIREKLAACVRECLDLE